MWLLFCCSIYFAILKAPINNSLWNFLSFLVFTESSIEWNFDKVLKASQQFSLMFVIFESNLLSYLMYNGGFSRGCLSELYRGCVEEFSRNWWVVIWVKISFKSISILIEIEFVRPEISLYMACIIVKKCIEIDYGIKTN